MPPRSRYPEYRPGSITLPPPVMLPGIIIFSGQACGEFQFR
jgi:hypothetical protein